MTVLADIMADAIWLAFNEARQEALLAMRMKRVKRFDAYGLHAFSEQFGRIAACQSADPDLASVLVSPVLMRKTAEETAYAEFRAEVKAS